MQARQRTGGHGESGWRGLGRHPESWALSFKPGFITHGLYDLEQAGHPLWRLCSHF